MSRTRKAVVVASFGYLQYGLTIAGGILLVPLTLYYIGARTYGLWLATGELLAYAAMIDFGILGVLPWMLAEADGRNDRDELRALVANGLAAGVVIAVGYAASVALLWAVLPSALHMTPADRTVVAPALLIVVCATTIAYPLRIFGSVLSGLQDVRFNGVIGVVYSILSVGLTVLLLWAGYGLVALGVAIAARTLFHAGSCLVRTMVVAPDLLVRWPRPTLGRIRHLLSNGLGGWLGGFGWQLFVASNSLVITRVAGPELVPVYVCTAKLGAIGTQLSWLLPDAGLVGLAQLHGEGGSGDRVRDVVLTMIRLHLLLAGAVASIVLAFNPVFVSLWVGDVLFGGPALNAMLAAGVIAAAILHGVLAPATALGHRLRAGVVMFSSGLIQIMCALTFGSLWGLTGIAAAGVLTALILAVPVGATVLLRSTELPWSMLWREVLVPWARRAAPVMAAAAALGLLTQTAGVFGSAAMTAILVAGYVWQMRPFYRDLPLEPHWVGWLVSFRLLPRAPSAVRPAAES